MIDAGEKSPLPLNMITWHCGTACCLCGDVALSRDWQGRGCYAGGARDFSYELDGSAYEVFNNDASSVLSIYDVDSVGRLYYAKESKLLTEEELKHPHLNINHSDRKIAHDYIRLVMRKVDERYSSDQL